MQDPHDEFPPDVAESIVTHMNEDHADAVLAIARAQGSAPDAGAARLLSIGPARLVIEIEPDNATGAGRGPRPDRGESDAMDDERDDERPSDGRRIVTVALEPPIDPLDTVRARLVTLTREARARLA